MFSTRAEIITRRTYNRPLHGTETIFETWDETVDRVIQHQQWLWERAKGSALTLPEKLELVELRTLMLNRECLPSGRTLWLGGTDVAKKREASQFNCSFGRVETVHDVVDAYWLLLQGCGVGFEPIVGTLNGFAKKLEIEVIRSTRTDRGNPENRETITNGVWRLMVGDSAEAWAKAVGKILANKAPCDKLILDFSEVRPAGERLKGYGWISSGDDTISEAFAQIAHILNRRAGALLDRIDILDVVNWLGRTLSSRRAAEIALVPYGDPAWRDFALAKRDHWTGNPQRAQSNNSLIFQTKPSETELSAIFDLIVEGGGSEPGFINAETALQRAPWFKGCNPCAEILLGNKSFCNLVETDLGKFNGRFDDLIRALYVIARANYRQTCVDLDDGILQRSWHELNQFLRLTGVGLTGIVRWEHVASPEAFRMLRRAAQGGVNSMADELGLPRSKAVTTVKPSGTLSKIMDTTEGVHKPLGRFMFNNVNFSKHDPVVDACREAGYDLMENPYDPTGVLVKFPVSYEDVEFSEVDGKFVNLESAVTQLERYGTLMDNYVDHNCSITVSYSPDEIPDIVKWIDTNWHRYVGVSFIYRNDPTKTAQDLGYPYLPQEVTTGEALNAYRDKLKPVRLSGTDSFDELDTGECASGACPVR